MARNFSTTFISLSKTLSRFGFAAASCTALLVTPIGQLEAQTTSNTSINDLLDVGEITPIAEQGSTNLSTTDLPSLEPLRSSQAPPAQQLLPRAKRTLEPVLKIPRPTFTPNRSSASAQTVPTTPTPDTSVASTNKLAPMQKPHSTMAQPIQSIVPMTDVTVQQTGLTSTEPNSSLVPAIPKRTMHALRAMNYEQFEQALLQLWGDQLRVSTSTDGRFARVLVPFKKQAESLTMLIDRSNSELTYEGEPKNSESWRQLVSAIDQPSAPSQVRQLVDFRPNDLPQIRQVALLINQEQDPVTIAQDIPEGLQNDPLALQRELGDGPQNPVQIQIIGNQLMITGSPDDVAKMKAAIERIQQQGVAKRSTQTLIKLDYQLSNTIVEAVQELYDSGFQESLGTAVIRPLQQPNGLLVVGRPEAIEQIRKIVELMDVETKDDVKAGDFKAYRLKYISAVDAQERIKLYFGLSQASNTGEQQPLPAPVVLIPDFRSNILVVKATPQYIVQVDKLIAELDVVKPEDGATNEVRVFQLKNALASELAIVIQDAITGDLPNAGQGYLGQNNQGNQGGQGNQGNQGLGGAGGGQSNPNTSSLRSAMLQLMTVGKNGELIQGGIMFDVRVSADTNGNRLVVTGPTEAMDVIAELVRQLDRIPDAETLIKVFPVENADANALLLMLQTLFTGGTNNQGGGQGQGQGQGISELPLQSAGASPGANLVNLRFGIDGRTNSIIVSGPASDLQVVEDLIIRLDQDDANRREVEVFRLSNAPVLDVFDVLQEYLDGREAAITEGDGSGTNAVTTVQARRRVIIAPEAVSNSLLISALPEQFADLERIIRKLDRRPPVVKVKVMIAEVNLSNLEEFGVEVGIQDSLLFDRGIDTIGFPFNQQSLGNDNASGRESVAGQALSNLGIGRVNSELGYGGLVLSAGNESVNVLLRALEDRSCVKVLSKPHIMTLENLQGRVQIGAQVPYITDVTQNNNGSVSNAVEFRDVGVILAVTPRVSPDGMIMMFVDVTNSTLGAEEDGIPIFISDGQVVRAPQINSTAAQTAVMARSGQTVVFSGLIRESKSNAERGTPILKDLPVIGPLFKFESDAADRSELLIFLTPFIADGDEDIDTLNQDEMDRMHWCLCDVAEVYGNADYQGYDGYNEDQQQMMTFYPDRDPTADNPQMPAYEEQAPARQPVEQFQQQSRPMRNVVPNQPIQGPAPQVDPGQFPGASNPTTTSPRTSLRRSSINR